MEPVGRSDTVLTSSNTVEEFAAATERGREGGRKEGRVKEFYGYIPQIRSN